MVHERIIMINWRGLILSCRKSETRRRRRRRRRRRVLKGCRAVRGEDGEVREGLQEPS